MGESASLSMSHQGALIDGVEQALVGSEAGVGDAGPLRFVPEVRGAVVDVGEIFDLAIGCSENDEEKEAPDVDFLSDDLLWLCVGVSGEVPKVKR